MDIDRRTFLGTTGVIAMTGLAGCSSVKGDVDLTADPVGLSSDQAADLEMQLQEYIRDTQEQELARGGDETDPIMLEFELNILTYASTVEGEQSNLAFVSTGSHKIVGQEINPVSKVTPRQIIQNVTSIEQQSDIEEIGTETITHDEYGELQITKYRTSITQLGQEFNLINYGLTEEIQDTVILGIGSHLEDNTQREESIKKGLQSFKVPTDAVSGVKPTDLADSTLSGVVDVEDINMEDLPI